MTLNNTDNAVIIVENRQTIGEHTDFLRTEAKGSFYRKDGKFYILYREQQEGANTATMIKADGARVTVKRSGAYESRMEYEEGREYPFAYATPYGQMRLTLVTKELEIALGEKGGSIRLQYELRIGDEAYHNQMTVKVTPKGERKTT